MRNIDAQIRQVLLGIAAPMAKMAITGRHRFIQMDFLMPARVAEAVTASLADLVIQAVMSQGKMWSSTQILLLGLMGS